MSNNHIFSDSADLCYFHLMQKEKSIYYLILFIVSFLTTLIVIPLLLLLLFPSAAKNALYLRLMVGYPISLAIISIVMKKSSGKGMKALIGPVDVKLFALIFLATLLISLIGCLFGGGIQPNQSGAVEIAISLLISILFIPMQCFSEELVFRILPQKIILPSSFSSPLRYKILSAVLSSAFFAVLHLPNSEALLFNSTALSFLYFFLSGIFLCALTFIEKGYTANISYHIANNIFIAALINRKDGETIPSEPFFFYEGNFDVFHTIISLVWAIIIIMAVEMIYIRHSRRAQIGKKDN